jgi:uncharacterized protein
MLLASLAGTLITLMTFPGTWLILLVALGCQWAFGEPRLFSWWTLGITTGLALAAEVYEFAASAVGSTKSGGGKSGAVGSIIGAIVGAILGSILLPIPVIGTLAGAVLGAGVGALALERGIAKKSWTDSYTIGKGAAIGRFTAAIIKSIIAAAIGITLTVAALAP